MDQPNTIKRLDGVGAIISTADGRVLVGKRKGSHGAGSWGLPGGHKDEGETELQTAEREVLEETGLVVRAVAEVALTEDDFVQLGKYYRTHFVYCEMTDADAQPEIKEPNKCETWEWKTWAELRALKGDSGPDEIIFRPLFGLVSVKSGLDELRPRK